MCKWRIPRIGYINNPTEYGRNMGSRTDLKGILPNLQVFDILYLKWMKILVKSFYWTQSVVRPFYHPGWYTDWRQCDLVFQSLQWRTGKELKRQKINPPWKVKEGPRDRAAICEDLSSEAKAIRNNALWKRYKGDGSTEYLSDERRSNTFSNDNVGRTERLGGRCRKKAFQ